MSNLQKIKHDKLASQIDFIHKSLVTDMPVTRISESTFVQEILPVLTGQVPSVQFATLVAGVAGSPFSEIDVIDSAGEVLFRMPALLERNVISLEEGNKRGAMHNMLITAELLMKNSPRNADRYLEHEFAGRGIATKEALAELIAKRHTRWQAIMDRYPMGSGSNPSKPGEAPLKVTAPAPQLDHSDDDLL